MTYFRELPDLEYQSFLSDSISSEDFLTIKNIFRRVKLRDDLQNTLTVFDRYQIPEGFTPDLVSFEIYGSVQFDWVVIVGADITRYRDQWPLSNRDLYNFALDKYGFEEINEISRYETTEVRDSENRLILPAGKVVDQNFRIPNPEIPGDTINPVTGISNYEYETRLNNDKREIFIIKPEFIQQVLNDTRNAMTYGRSSQFITDRLIRTENTRATDSPGFL